MYICKSYDGIYHFKFVLFQNAAYSIANNTEVYIKPDKGNAPQAEKNYSNTSQYHQDSRV